jgi:prepilin-type N-terminal cleavage/methylation domain-containing protein
MTARNGLTLIELLVTLAIMGMLTVTALGVAGRLARREKQYRDDNQRDFVEAEAGLRRLLALDLPHAARLRNRPGGFDLKSRSRLRSQTLELQHLSAEIFYDVEVSKTDATPRLVRTQKTPDGLIAKDLAWVGVSSIRITSVGGRTIGADVDEQWQGGGGTLGVEIRFAQPMERAVHFDVEGQ